ncbi:uncharacterized protein LOC9328581 isoform X3 [Arabidopsis lyrata subsp. lyrata]|uniref:uncharacterized protein LOC9328581 isoform X3 n=1 Tax=Arabidopsis lyrata subsp. lyrata TaxID=81972 RepID=UPI000A29E40D|nr:uncharacterized protein LOC9328581 isoform X3 [Arabidopsis lyrata subsp. lyrata]|eukprot:XP_020868171.1 uncharacterized protein LOC9328581 isoform X3 [Arabidopsis lyrata subsp. lyrata]
MQLNTTKMVDDTSSNSRKRIITEGDIATLLQRYDMKTILKMLQEMAYYSEIKMDWNELVKKTTTGITNAREYQSLWRHLSYRHPLLPVEDDAQPLDDDSDMECELEASPAVSHEASVEAIAHVKVMAASYVPNESDILDNSTKVTSTEGMNGNGSAGSSMAFRKKRKKWSAQEDEELFAAVKRCGEGNWAHIVKGDFRGKRTASQLSQRWALIRKRCDTLTSVSQSGLQPTEAQIAVNHAISLALGNRPPSKKLAIGVMPTTSSCSITEPEANGGSSSQGQQQFKPIVQALPRAGTSLLVSKSRVVKKSTASSTSRSNLMVTANSVAAAACMGDVLTAASRPKVEPGKTDAPLVPKTKPAKNASTACMPRPSGSLSMPKVEPGTSVAASSIIKAVGPANMRPLANGELKPVTASSSSNKLPLMAPRSEGSTMLSASAPLASPSRIVSNQRVFAASVPATVLQPKPTAETVTCKPDGGQKGQARGNEASSSAAIQPHQMTSINSEIRQGKQATQAQSPNLLPRKVPVVRAAVHCATNHKLVDNPSDKTVVPIRGAGSQSKAKDEVNSKVGPALKVSSVCGKPLEVATVAGTGQGV